MSIFTIFLIWNLLQIASTRNVSVIEKAADLTAQVYQKHFITSLVWNDDYNPDHVEIFLKRYQGVVTLTSLLSIKPDVIKQFHKSYRQTVFLASKAEELIYFFKVFNKYVVVPIRVIIVLHKIIPERSLVEMIKSAWSNDFANILIVSPNDKGDNVTLRTYFPFTERTCNNFSLVTLHSNSQNLFPNKFRNFYGCEIRSTLLEMAPYNKIKFKSNNDSNAVASISGIDADIFSMLYNILNATIKFVSARKHGNMGALINGTATGCLGELVNKSADVFCPAGIITAPRYSLVQISHIFDCANLFWFGPPRREISEWLQVLQPFMTHLTPALLTSFLVFVVTVMMVHRYGYHRSSSKDSVLFQSFVVFIGQIVKLEARSWLINGLFLLWIWFCLVVRIAYQSELVEGMQNTILEPRLKNLNAAVKQVDGYGGVDSFRQYLENTSYYNNYKVFEFLDVPKQLKYISEGKRFLIMTDKQIGFEASRRLQILSKDPISQNPVGFYLRPGWPPAEEVDVMILRLIESGFVHKINSDNDRSHLRRTYRRNDREARPMTMDTLSACFYVLGVLYVVCILVFISEIIYYKKYDQKKILL